MGYRKGLLMSSGRNLERFCEEGMTEEECRRKLLSQYQGTMGKLCLIMNFDPEGSEFCPAIYDYPEKVAAWLRQWADDIERLR